MKKTRSINNIILIMLSLFMILITFQVQDLSAENNETTIEQSVYYEIDGELVEYVEEVVIEDLGVADTYVETPKVKTFNSRVMMSAVPEEYAVTFSSNPSYASFTNLTGEATVTINATPTSAYEQRLSYVTNNASSGVFPILDSVGTRYKIAISGVIGWVDHKYIGNITSFSNAKSYNYYEINNEGELVHRVAQNPTGTNFYPGYIQGKAPSYLKKGTKYLSYDGMYFYELSPGNNGLTLSKLISDYNKDSTIGKQSVNANSPYINYFQWLPFRTQTNLTAADYTRYLSANSSTTSLVSRLVGTEQLFIDTGNHQGLNPTIGFMTAIHESGFGKSNFAKERNNYFGHAAFDSNVGAANTYISPFYAIENHFGNYWNAGYVHQSDWRNQGSIVGNKGSGVNVFYASDAYWGEKIAQHYYKADKLAGFKDYMEYTIAIIEPIGIGIKTQPNTAVNAYENKSKNSAIAILEEVDGEMALGSKKWYGFTGAPVLDNNKKEVSKNEILKYGYNQLSNKTVYVHSSFVKIVSQGKNSKLKTQTKPKLPTHVSVSNKPESFKLNAAASLRPDPSTNYPEIYRVPAGTQLTGYISKNGWYQVLVQTSNGLHLGYVKSETWTGDGSSNENENEKFAPGDVNGDGRVSSLDFMLIKQHIMKIRILKGDELKRADVDGNGVISSRDYMYIKTVIMRR